MPSTTAPPASLTSTRVGIRYSSDGFEELMCQPLLMTRRTDVRTAAPGRTASAGGIHVDSTTRSRLGRPTTVPGTGAAPAGAVRAGDGAAAVALPPPAAPATASPRAGSAARAALASSPPAGGGPRVAARVVSRALTRYG